ncbi:cytochrome c551 [Oceanobacillus sp. FSL H7-0719]|uniref:cytochrome c551 n=1 Tax=Oceanobacillus sp. FSL H7-0719 TaxID=2954507 RepID=UPI00324986D0
MKKWLLAVLFGAVLVLGACGGGDDDNASEEPADNDNGTEESADSGESVDTAAGEEVYQTNCAMCHGADLSGGAGPDLTAVGSSYTQDEIAEIVTNGIGSMPPQKVSGDDLDALSAWLAEKK